MCNQHRLKSAIWEIHGLFADLGFPLVFPEGLPNVEARDCIRITDVAPIVRPGEDGGELVQRPWSWRGPNGAPVFNFRSEGRRFATQTRCAVPTNGFFEFTAPADPKARRKDRWLFTMPAAPLFFIAGVMREDAWSMLTTQAGPDVAPLHPRQVVVLGPRQAVEWLSGAPEVEFLHPSAKGVLVADRVA
jgi:putative SOS response-associated peptidase YedK